MNNPEFKIPVLSFFTGGGFLDMGFEQAGFEVVFTNEMNPLFAELFEHGYSSWKRSTGSNEQVKVSHIGSIESMNPDEILTKAFNEGTPNQFGIIGGPPCQDFSAAGNNEGFKGRRGRMTKVFFEYIKELNPSFFVIENVRNLGNKNKHGDRLKELIADLEGQFWINQKVLNTIHFGVPQDRTRLFIVGIRKSKEAQLTLLQQEFSFPWPSVKKEYKDALTSYSWPEKTKFQNGVTKPLNIPSELYVEGCLLDEKSEASVPNGTDYFQPHSPKFKSIEEGNTRARSFKRLHRYKYSPTACYGNNEVHLHPFLPRRLSVRETLRIQSVPDTYVLPDHIGLSSKFKLIGNGVPVKLANAVAQSMMSFLRVE